MGRLAEQHGLTLIEAIIAAALLALALTPVLGLFVASRESAEVATRRMEASMLARSSMDGVISQSAWASIQSSGPVPHPLDSRYTLTVKVTNTRATWLKDVVVHIEWVDGGQTQSLELFSSVYKREGAA